MRYFFIDNENTLNFIVCGQLVSKNNFLHMRRNFNENVLILVLEGTLFINSHNKNFQIGKNQYILLKANEEHFGYKESDGLLKYYWVHFSDRILENDNLSDLSKNQKYFFPETGSFDNNSRLLLLFKQLMDFSLDTNFYTKDILNYSLSTFMMEFTQNNLKKSVPNNIPSIVNDICIWIKNNYQTNFSITDLSDEFGYQSSYLSNLFRKSMNMSIIQYVTDIRITASKNLLSNFSVKETAYSCGFEDEKYFMKTFKKYEGITPGQYKQAFSKKNINN